MRILKCILTISPVLFRAHSMPHSPQIRNYETENIIFEHLTRNKLNEKTCRKWEKCDPIILQKSYTLQELNWTWKHTNEVKLYELMKERSHIHSEKTSQNICENTKVIQSLCPFCSKSDILYKKYCTVLYHSTIRVTLLYIHTVQTMI